jgi:CheY-like chemotaxis protein/DNA-binding XRE family transcriptional regulator
MPRSPAGADAKSVPPPAVVNDLPPHVPGSEGPPGGLCYATDVRLLIVDDDEQICRLIATALSGDPFQIDSVWEPDQMEARLKAKRYDIILLDYVLPNLEADEVLGWVRDYQPEASVIVMTGFPSIDSALTCLRAGTFDYLTKPFQMSELQRVVRRCLEAKGLLRLSEEAVLEALGAAIRERRKAVGLTLSELGDRAGVSGGYLSQIELGKNSASIETLYRIALALRLKLSDLFQSVHGPTEPTRPKDVEP